RFGHARRDTTAARTTDPGYRRSDRYRCGRRRSPRRGRGRRHRHLSPEPTAGRSRCHLAAVRCARPDAVSAMVQQAVAHLGGLDVLVNAAGLWQPGIPGYIGAEEISFLLDTNVKATILTNQAAHAAMKGAGGSIINFGSSEALMGSPISAV